MRTYILTARERVLVEAFIESKEVAPEDLNNYWVLRHQFRKHEENLTQDLALLQKFMATTRRPPCFGSEEVVWKEDYPNKCLKCDVQAECLVDNCRQKVFP